MKIILTFPVSSLRAFVPPFSTMVTEIERLSATKPRNGEENTRLYNYFNVFAELNVIRKDGSLRTFGPC